MRPDSYLKTAAVRSNLSPRKKSEIDVSVVSCLPSCTFFLSWHHNVTGANDSHYHLKGLLSYANHDAEHIFATCFSLSYFGVVWAVFTDIHLLRKEKPQAWNSISLFKCFCLTSILWISNVFECWSFLYKSCLYRETQTNKKGLDQRI